MGDDQLFLVRDRNLDFPVFDADNHMYENTDSFLKFMPRQYEGLIKCVGEGNRQKIAIKDRIDRQFQAAYDRTPQLFDEDPMEVLRRNVFIHLFQEKNPLELIAELGVENSMFGSDFPHPEGRRDPLAFSDQITSLSLDDQKRVMGGNLAGLVGAASWPRLD